MVVFVHGWPDDHKLWDKQVRLRCNYVLDMIQDAVLSPSFSKIELRTWVSGRAFRNLGRLGIHPQLFCPHRGEGVHTTLVS